MANPTVIVTGGGGRLALELKKEIPGAILLDRRAMDVTDPARVDHWILNGSIVIHCAAVLANEAETNRLKAWAVNVAGTENVAAVCARRGAKLVYISSDYVFKGRGLYCEDSRPHPINFYGQTKAAGERIALASPNNLVLRAPFRYGPPWIYDNAFEDQWTSARWIGEVAPDIAQAALSELTGILHIGGPRRSIYELATSAGVQVKPSSRLDWKTFQIPADTSLNSQRWLEWKARQ